MITPREASIKRLNQLADDWDRRPGDTIMFTGDGW